MNLNLEELKLEALKNALYHEDREQFFAKLHRWLMFFVLTGGLVTVATATQGLGSLVLQVCGAMVFLFGVLDLVFDTSGRARLHASLRRRYYEFLSEALRCPSRVSSKQLCELNAQLALIAGDETPFAHGTLANAYNDAHLVMGHDPDSKDLMSMNWFERLTRNVLPYSATWFESVGEKEKRKKKRSAT